MHTQPDGRKTPTAPPQWPFGTICRQAQKQQAADMLTKLSAAPF